MLRLHLAALFNAAFICGFITAAAVAEPSIPQHSMPGMQGMPGMAEHAPGPASAPSPPMEMSDMQMSSSTDLNDPMSREGSGTSWLPDSTPMYGKMTMHNGDMFMLHGAAMPRYVHVGSARGDSRFDMPNWAMGMYSHPLGSDAQLGIRAMMSLDPITEGGNGYPLLYQTGETWHGQPLHDRQHPHDLFDELSATYSRLIGHGNSVSLYLADPGEPALGPPTYMHRLLAYDLPDAPIGHHWQDATHITFGVATAGLNIGGKFKLEGSIFTGREPDENRYNFDKPRWDSQSGRLSYNPDPNNTLQASYGFVKNAEGDGANQHRITASWVYNRPLGADSNFTSALVWGQNNLTTEGRSNSFLEEADYQRGANSYFARFEQIQKSGHELVLPAPLEDAKYSLGAYTVGYVRDLTHNKGDIDTGLGAAVTLDTRPAALDPVYGHGPSNSFEIFLRFRPARMRGMSHAMHGDSMSTMEHSDSGNTAPDHADQGPAHSPGGTSASTALPPGVNPAPLPTTPAAPTAAPSTAPSAPTAKPSIAPSAPAAKPSIAPSAPAETPSTTAVPQPEAPRIAPKAVVAHIAASLAPSPPVARHKNVLTVILTDSDHQPVTGAAVSASVEMTEMDMGTSHPAFTEAGNGRYSAAVQFSMPGLWRITVRAVPRGGAPVVKSWPYQVARQK